MTLRCHIIKKTYDPDLIPTQESKVLHVLVTDPNASASNAVQQVLNLTTTELSSKNDMFRDQFKSKVAWSIGVLIIDIAANTAPVQQTKLLDFVPTSKGYRDRPENGGDGQVWEFWVSLDGSSVVWDACC